jgi:hypothetical protein
MISIGQPYIEHDGNYAYLKAHISIDTESNILWFKVEERFSKYLCYERGDAYLIAVLHYAMENSHDIELDVPITEDLIYNLQTYLIEALIENNPTYYRPNIKAEIISEPIGNAGAVGTGISCGVDSLHSLASHHESRFSAHNITHLTYNNVGSHGVGDSALKLYQSRLKRPIQFAKEYGFELVISDSNLMNVIKQDHYLTHTYSSMFPVFCLQKLYKTYLYASAGYRFNEFSLKQQKNICCGSYEMLSLETFSNGNVHVLSEGMGKSRLEKLRKVISYKPSYKYLNVCLLEEDNCGKCEKCIRTLLELDALNALDKYSNVFDINYYKKHRKWYLQQMLYQMAVGRHDYHEIYPYFKSEITISMRIKVVIRKCMRLIVIPLWKKIKYHNN